MTGRPKMIHAVAALILALPLAQAGALELAPPDVSAAYRADQRQPGPHPTRFAVAIPVDIRPSTHGQWRVDPDGDAVWMLEVSSTGALSLNFGMMQFSLPESGALWVHGARETHGPYKSSPASVPALWTPVVRGERARIEVRVPSHLRPEVDLHLTQVGYGVRPIGSSSTAAKSGSCNVDVVCSEGNGWRDEIRSVARISVGGAFLCTGQLVNNTAQDFTPYFLTAAHCLSTEAEALATVFYFNNETSQCGATPDGSLDQTVTGSSLVATSDTSGGALATNTGSDFTLLQLSQDPPEAFNVHYAGWDNRDVAPASAVSIHHPSGDEKRISFEFDALDITTYGEAPDSPATQLNPSHLRVADWDIGTTEGGSSGGGLWNADHRLVGQLSGGSAACGNDEPDWYGRFHRNWFASSLPIASLAPHLDPDGTGVAVLDGADPGAPSSPATQPPESAQPAPGGGSSGGGLDGVALVLLASVAVARRRARR